MLSEKTPDLDIGEYYYEISINPSRNGCCKVHVVERIAVVISAMLNTSGGVLELQIEPGACISQLSLEKVENTLVRIITAQEKWIPHYLFAKYVERYIQWQINRIYFFVNKASHLVTHCYNAYSTNHGEIKLITDYNVSYSMVCECSFPEQEPRKNHNNQQEVHSAVLDTEHLEKDTCLPVKVGEKYLCRAYNFRSRTLVEVLNTQSVSRDIKEMVSALANTSGGSIFLGVAYSDVPQVKGYKWNGNSSSEIEELLSEIIDGTDRSGITIWSSVSSAKKKWKVFIHPVSGGKEDTRLTEIRVQGCPGGMFCSMPLCYMISYSGDILPLNRFEEWKEKIIQTPNQPLRERGPYETHFSDALNDEEVKEADLPVDVMVRQDKMSSKVQETTKDQYFYTH